MATNGYVPAIAYELVLLCNASYQQLFASMTPGAAPWNPPPEYRLERVLRAAWEGGQPPIGFIAIKDDNVYIAWRGTVRRQEWWLDAQIGQRPFPFLDDGSMTEIGFTDLYATDRSVHNPSPRNVVIDYLQTECAGKKVYVTGHSLGGSLATLNACDIAANTAFKDISVYTFATPRTGNPQFALTYNRHVHDSWRVFNSNDPVPHSVPDVIISQPTSVATLPRANYYVHVNQDMPITFGWPQGGILNHAIDGYVNMLAWLKDQALSNRGLTAAALPGMAYSGVAAG